jgi:formylglycine-generating enzyme required for sulfatase activity
VHTVYLDAFYIDRTEVTNADFAKFLEEPGYQTVGEGAFGEGWWAYAEGKDNHPRDLVRWNGADAYCRWAGKRLPTEAEWEKAAWGTDGRTYPWGNDFDCHRGNFDDEQRIDDYVVPGGPNCDGYVGTAPVGSYPAGASPYGSLDMAGNVSEWVADAYDSGYYSQSPGLNPPGPDSGWLRVVRRGSCLSVPNEVRCATRDEVPRDQGAGDIGFRCARNSE